jgi:potassium-transporting ATPase KdpC subunit
MRRILRPELRPALVLLGVLTLATGVVYPLAVTALAWVLFPAEAGGSLVVRDGRVVGSRLLAQAFADARYFHPRPSAAGPAGYDAAGSGGSNLGPTDARLLARVRASVGPLAGERPGVPVPVDLVTASGSGLDPDLTPAAALFQVPRVARARGVAEDRVGEMVRRATEGRQYRLLGEPRVNVLLVNLMLDAAQAAGTH